MIEVLLSLILMMTGITRDVDPELTALAQARAVQVSTDATFNHDGRRADTYEVLAWSIGYSDPVQHAIQGWRASPAHWAVLSNASLTRIGCGHAVGVDGRHVFACVLLPGTVAQPVEPVAPVEPVMLPNTASAVP